MNDAQVIQYVKAAARALELPLDAARAARVADHLARTAALAKVLESAPLGAEDEPAEVYRPAPLPQGEPGA